MKITITGRKVNLKDNFKDLTEKKLSKLEKIFSDNSCANVTVTLGKNYQTVEITIRDNGMIYRAESTTSDMNESLDKSIDALKRQIRKHKAKLGKRLKSASIVDLFAEEEVSPIENNDVEGKFEVVRTKQFPIKPLDVEEAILQMNMIEHKFFMFRNVDTEQINVVYVRKDGTYGLLEPDDTY